MKNVTNYVFVLLCYAASAQVPQSLNYQAVARDANGNPLSNQFVSVQISIRDGSPASPVVYQEIDTSTTNQFGLFAVAIGTGILPTGSFTGINWATGNKYLQVGLNPNGGIANFTDMGTSQLLSVPYALYAANGGLGATGATGAAGATGATGAVGSAWSDYAVYSERDSAGFLSYVPVVDSLWFIRPLNYSEFQVGSNISRTGYSDSILIQPGTYFVTANSGFGSGAQEGIGGNSSSLRIRDLVNNVTLLNGSEASIYLYASQGYTASSYLPILVQGVFVVNAQTYIGLEEYGSVGSVQGVAFNVAQAAVYSRIVIQKIN